MRRVYAIIVFFCLILAAGCSSSPATRAVSAVSETLPVPQQTPTPVGDASSSAAPERTVTAEPDMPAVTKTRAAGTKHPASTAGAAPAKEPAKPAKAVPRLAILVYHDVDESFQSDYTITPAHLEAQIQMLQAEGYYFYRLTDVEKLLAGGEGLPEKGVMLAFDDGYQSYASKVLPLAQKYNIPAVCFVVTKYMTFDIIFGRPHMATVELQAVIKSGLLDLAGHSYDGHRLGLAADGSQQPVLTVPIKPHLAPAVETQAEYEARVLDDFRQTSRILKELGTDTGTRHFTFPFTARSEDAVRLGQQAGFKYFYVGGDQLVTPQTDPTSIPRIHAGAPYITADVLKETLRRLFAE